MDQLLSCLPHLGETWQPARETAPLPPTPAPSAPSTPPAPMASGRGTPSVFGDLFGGLFDDHEDGGATAPTAGGVGIKPIGPPQKPGGGGGSGGGTGGGGGRGGGGGSGGGGQPKPAPGQPGYKPEDGWDDPKPKPPVHFFGAPDEDLMAAQGIGEFGTLGLILLLMGAPELAPVLLL